MVIVKNKENIGMLFVFRLVFWFFFKTFLFFMLVIEGFKLIFGSIIVIIEHLFLFVMRIFVI